MTSIKSWMTRIGFGVGFLIICYLEVQNYRLKSAQKAVEKAKDEALAAQAVSEGWVQAREKSWTAIFDGLNRENLDLGADVERLRKSDPSLRPIAVLKDTVSIKDSVPGVVSVVGPACPVELTDEYGRFRVSVPQKSGELPIFNREQQFVFDAVVLKRLNGQFTFAKSELREYEPGKEPSPATLIPSDGIAAKLDLQIASEAAPAVKPFHPRAVFALDHRAAVGGGVEFLHLFGDKAELSVVGLYDKADKSVDLAVSAGYRVTLPLINSNVSIGPNYYPLSKKLGVGVTVELSR